MDKKSKILIYSLVALITIVTAITFSRYMILKDYVVEAQVDCDPYSETCFIWQCDPESDVSGEACTGDPESDIWFFKVAYRNASNIPLCDPETDETCDPFTCYDGEKDCEEAFCTEENMEAQYASACNDPEEYTLENPYECDPEVDEDCEATEEEECDLETDEDCVPAEECDPEVDGDCVPAEESSEEGDATEVEGEVEGVSACGEEVECEGAEEIGEQVEAATSEVVEK